MTTTTNTATPAVRGAFTVNEAALHAADTLAARIASEKLTKADMPDAIRRTFREAGFDEAAAEAEVERHRRIIECRRRIAEGKAAGAELARLDSRRDELSAELGRTEERINAELRSLQEPRWEASTRQQHASDARRALERDLLPAFVLARLSPLQTRRAELAAEERRLDAALGQHRPMPLDPGLLASMSFERSREDERKRVEAINHQRAKAREEFERRLEAIRRERAVLDDRGAALRGHYL